MRCLNGYYNDKKARLNLSIDSELKQEVGEVLNELDLTMLQLN